MIQLRAEWPDMDEEARPHALMRSRAGHDARLIDALLRECDSGATLLLQPDEMIHDAEHDPAQLAQCFANP